MMRECSIIPGRTAGPSPEPMNTEAAGAAPHIGAKWSRPVFMGSGLIAAQCPGMTMEQPA